MPKEYWIGHVEGQEPAACRKYIEGAAPTSREHGANYLVRGGKFDAVGPVDPGSRRMVTEFDSLIVEGA